MLLVVSNTYTNIDTGLIAYSLANWVRYALIQNTDLQLFLPVSNVLYPEDLQHIQKRDVLETIIHKGKWMYVAYTDKEVPLELLNDNRVYKYIFSPYRECRYNAKYRSIQSSEASSTYLNSLQDWIKIF